MGKRISSIILASAAFAAGVTAVTAASYRMTEKLVKLALNRSQPESKSKKGKRHISGEKKSAAVTKAVKAAADTLETVGCERVEIQARDGINLVGHWYACENAKRTVVAMHGWRSSWKNDFGMISDFLFKNSCNVLFAEQRGQGESGGDYMGFGLLERFDCFEWIKWVNRTVGTELPIYLAGISMGATTVLMTAGLDLPKNVKGIISDCGFTSPDAIWRHIVNDNLHMVYRLHRSAANDICRRKIQIRARDYSTVDAMKITKTPILFIHGTDDKFVPITMTYENYKACVAPKHLLVVPGAEHALSYYVDRNQYEKAVKEFWEEYDN